MISRAAGVANPLLAFTTRKERESATHPVVVRLSAIVAHERLVPAGGEVVARRLAHKGRRRLPQGRDDELGFLVDVGEAWERVVAVSERAARGKERERERGGTDRTSCCWR